MAAIDFDIFNASQIGTCIIQNNTVQLMNPSALLILGYSPEEIAGSPLEKIVAQTDYLEIEKNESLRLAGKTAPAELDFTLMTRTQATLRVKGYFAQIEFENHPATLLQFVAAINPKQAPEKPISSLVAECLKYKEVFIGKKQMEERIIYLTQTDALTNLFNRTFFEKELQKIEKNKCSFALIICDLDGLKLVNDTMGLHCGDQIIIATAKAIRKTFPRCAIFRIGGDEFAIVLECIDETVIKHSIRTLQEIVTLSNRKITNIPITLSCGYAISVNGLIPPENVYLEADNYMLKKKLFRAQSNHSAVFQTLTKALQARDFITEGHAERMHSLVVELATKVGLSELRQTNLRLFAQFHDIGKVGIPDSILFKNSNLTVEEKEMMKRHSEIGFRIAHAAPDLAHLSDWILKHHEWWNGNGYPLGISGKDIPLECRILSIVDAFDAMTHDRPYREALPAEAALAEIDKYSGVQFDPELVRIFIRLVNDSKSAVS
jgi:diguanylate cyclase (GGDEF)-like protein